MISALEALANTSLCLRCRTLLGAGEDCDECGAEHVVSLSNDEARELLRVNAWTAVRWDGSRMKRVAIMIASGGGLLAVIVGAATGHTSQPHLLVLGIVIATVAAMVAVLVMGGHVGLRRPRGASLRPSLADAPLVGRIVGDQQREVANLLELTVEGAAGEVALRAASSDGFLLALEDGRRVEVSPGRVRIAADTSESLRDYDAFLAEFGLPEPMYEVLPHQGARRVALSEGDRVELSAELEPIDETSSYRTKGRLRALGIPRLRKL